ncbi:Crp/Fnr family transcriptional regulator [Flagellimonas sp. HMM57]|uniref:Crp/Fnr family transcriptional regulator n=1 Tax=unclassified Flagellimonas TaxID=2644544 RepID=UPI0013D2439C|nr:MULTISPECIES: Crp/Fnr family transcriptional regulator [unclassified Flagellimonas]UII75161.1 Crp/Fnr family transcriptional regulator [Flagellimonas sp. HMM57]
MNSITANQSGKELYSANETILRKTLDKFNVLNDTEFSDFLNVCEYKEFAKKQYLLKSGNYNNGIYFLISGAVGLFEPIEGKEMYQNFFLEREFAHELKSLTTQTPSTKNLIALSDTTLFHLSRKKLLELYEKSISFERLGRKLLEHLLNGQNEISYVLQSLKPEERYAYLENKRPNLLHTIPLTYLASYLGLARETLSRIRAKR